MRSRVNAPASVSVGLRAVIPDYWGSSQRLCLPAYLPTHCMCVSYLILCTQITAYTLLLTVENGSLDWRGLRTGESFGQQSSSLLNHLISGWPIAAVSDQPLHGSGIEWRELPSQLSS